MVYLLLLLFLVLFIFPSKVDAQTNSSPGVYVFGDYTPEQDTPAQYPFLKGGVAGGKWKRVDSEGWGLLNSATPPRWSMEGQVRARAGMKLILVISLHDGDYQRTASWGEQLGDQTPEWVYSRFGVGKINLTTSDGKRWQFPKYTDTKFLDAMEETIKKFAQDYDGDPRIEMVWVGAGVYGESYPYPYQFKNLTTTSGKTVNQIFLEQGITPQAWETYTKNLIGLYKKYFTKTPLYFSPMGHPGGNSAHNRALVDDAIRQGLHIAAHYIAAEPDTPFFALPNYSGYLERWSWVKDYVVDGVGLSEPRKLYVESGESWTDETLSYWQILMSRDKHASYFGAYPEQVRNPNLKAAWDWFNDYAGKTLATTPGAWIAFRKESSNLWQSQKDGTYTVTSNTPQGLITRNITLYANYSQWFTQYNPDGTTVPLWNIGSKEGKFARRTDLGSNKKSFYLSLDDGYISPQEAARFNTSSGGKQAEIKVKYLDNGYGSFNVEYDSSSGKKVAGTTTKTNSNAWKTASFSVSDAYFGNRLGNSSDLQVNALNQDVTLHMVEVRVSSQANIEQQIQLLFNAWGTANTQFDLDKNNKVNGLDYVLLLNS